MKVKVKDIKPKHLVLGEVFDDFARATDIVDFSQEDLCSYVTTLVNNYYWLNTESVWGPLGFTWSRIPTEDFPGYGTFNPSNIGFSVVPSVPDGYRHITLEGLLDKLTITQDMTILDSNWTNFKSTILAIGPVNTGHRYILHLDSLKGKDITLWGKNIRSGGTHPIYQLHGELDSVKIKDVALSLVPENKNKLMVDMSMGRTIKIYVEDIDGDSFDLRDFVKLDIDKAMSLSSTTYTPPSIYFRNDSDLRLKNLTIAASTYYNGVNFVANVKGDNIKATDPKDENYKKVLLDSYTCITNLDASRMPTNRAVYTATSIPYVKKFNYIGLDQLNDTRKINIYWAHGYFEEIPEVTDFIWQNTSGNIFYYCIFIGDYKYGKLKATQKMFSQDCIAKYDDINITDQFKEFYMDPFAYAIESGECDPTGSKYVLDFKDHIQFEYDNDNVDKEPNRHLCFPTIKTIGYTSYAAVTMDCEEYNYYGNSKHYFPYNRSGNLIVWNWVNYADPPIIGPTGKVIVKPSARYDDSRYRYTVHGDTFVDNIIFDIDRGNITDTKELFNNSLYFVLCKRLLQKESPLIFRCHNNLELDMKYTWDTNRFSLGISTEDTNIIIYNCSISIKIIHSWDDEPSVMRYTNSQVQHLLESIVTIGDVTDSAKRTITLDTSFYQNMKEEVKARLLGDGYTIVEVI